MVVALVACAMLAGAASQATEVPARAGGTRAVPASAVRLEGVFWGPRLATNARATLEANFDQCDATGRVRNFERAASGGGAHEGYFFNDSDVYKAIEGACLAMVHAPDAAALARVNEVVRTVVAAQLDDGYLNTYYQLTGIDKRFSDLRVMHELYCGGHLIEAGVAHHALTGDRTLLDAAIRFADLVDATFRVGGRPGVPGHEELELALFRLAEHTGEARYAALAQHFVEARGRAEGRELFGEYAQDHLPIRAQDEAVGHAVRATYLYAAATDLARRTREPALVEALDRLWDDVTRRKMYVTGGLGSSSHNEGFTVAYDLPNEEAYAETCAAIGLVLWAHRMSLLHGGDGRYADVLERALYNGVLSGVGLDGRSFFYVNPLGSRGDRERQAWYDCACCPPNILRLLARLPGMVYAQDERGVIVQLYGSGSATVEHDGARVALVQQTLYPWDGSVRLAVEPSKPMAMALRLRIPSWCRGATVRVNGSAVEALPTRGLVTIERAWSSGDVVELSLPMAAERVSAHPRVRSTRGRVAVQRGPIVYCVEAADHGGSVRRVALPPDATLRARFDADRLGGVTVVEAMGLLVEDDAGFSGSLYRPAAAPKPIALTFVPYSTWANRGGGEMVVWVPESTGLIERPAMPGARASASHVWRLDSAGAMIDGVLPRRSSDHDLPRMTWWPRRGSEEWAAITLPAPTRVSTASVYWFDDTGVGGGCALPAEWSISYRSGDEWVPVRPAEGERFGVEADRFNRVRFAPVVTRELRLEVRLREGRSAGVLEWTLD